MAESKAFDADWLLKKPNDREVKKTTTSTPEAIAKFSNICHTRCLVPAFDGSDEP